MAKKLTITEVELTRLIKKIIKETKGRLLEQDKEVGFFELENDALDFTEQVARLKKDNRYKGKPEEAMMLNKNLNTLILNLKNTINTVTSNKKWFK